MNTRQEFDQMIRKTTLTDQEFEEFKKVILKRQVSLARKAATFYGMAAMTVLIGLVYGFVMDAKLTKRELVAVSTEAELKVREQRSAEIERYSLRKTEELETAYARIEKSLKDCENRK
jgi:hypothetical protein